MKTKKEFKRAIFAGTFDPPTNAHVDLLKTALPLFDQVLIVVATNTTKKPLLEASKRIHMLEAILQEEKLTAHCEVKEWNRLLPEACKLWDVSYLIRGIRNAGDLEQEFLRADANLYFAGVQTLFFPSKKEYIYCSSSMVREIHLLEGDTSHLIPASVQRLMTI